MMAINNKCNRLLIKPFFLLIFILKVDGGLSQEGEVFIADTLENGFTYFIKSIENSEEKVYMDLIIRSGYSRQIEGQYALAHFVEHQPVKEFLNEVYSDDKIFGSAIRSNDLYFNGGTSMDHSSYSYIYPSSNPVFTDKGLSFFSELVSGNKKLDRDIFEAEKGAFYQEIAFPVIENSQYKKQLIKGAYSNCHIKPVKPDDLWAHIKNYEFEETEDFIKKWYRPELSTLIIVGDINNIEELQAKIKDQFSSEIKSEPVSQKNCKETLSSHPPKFMVLKNQKFIPGSRSEVKFHFYKKEEQIRSGLSEINWNFLKPFLSQFLTSELWNNLRYPNSPTLPSISWSSDFPVLDIMVKTEFGKEEHSLSETFKFLNLLKYKGISKEQWRQIHDQGVESLPPPNTKSAKHWLKIFDNLALGEEQITSQQRENLLKWWGKLNKEDFNYHLRKLLNQDIIDFAVIAPFSSELNQSYWKEKTKTWISENGFKTINNDQAFKDSTYAEEPRDIFGARVFLLSNGQKIVIREFPKNKGDEEFISFHAFKNVGASNFNPKDYYTARLAPEIIQNSGYGEFDKFDMQEVKASNSIQKLNAYITDTESGIEGKLVGRNFSVFFELIDHHFNSPRKDSLAFMDWQTSNWHKYLNPGETREISDFNWETKKILNIPSKDLGISDKFEASRKVKEENALKIYNSIFGDARGFTFLIGTSVKAEEILPQIEKRFGGKSYEEIDLKSLDYKGDSKSKITQEFIEVPSIPNANALITIKYLNKIKNSDWKTKVYYQILTQFIRRRTPELRFLKDQAIYRFGTIYVDSKESKQVGVSIVISTLQEQVDSLSESIQDIIKDLQQNEISKLELKRVLEHEIIPKNVQEWQQNPSKTLKKLHSYYSHKVIPPQNNVIEEFILNITPEDVKAAANKLLNETNKKEIIGIPNINEI